MNEKSLKWTAFFVIFEVELETDLNQLPEEVFIGIAVGAGQQLVDILKVINKMWLFVDMTGTRGFLENCVHCQARMIE